MAYSHGARALRRCTATTTAGKPCRGWATWGDPTQRCIAHGGRARTVPRGRGPHHARAEPCRCRAYRWPHRPGSGWCRWPLTPTHRHTTPPSTHRWPTSFREKLRRLLRGTSLGGPSYLAKPSPLSDRLGWDYVEGRPERSVYQRADHPATTIPFTHSVAALRGDHLAPRTARCAAPLVGRPIPRPPDPPPGPPSLRPPELPVNSQPIDAIHKPSQKPRHAPLAPDPTTVESCPAYC